MDTLLQQAQEALQKADRVVVITGAGVSAESGVPTFRGQDGLWRRYDPTQLATPEAFARDPKLVWEWYNWRREILARCKPNPGHEAIARLEQRVPDFLLVTQNVDGLHGLAGSRNVIEIHGSIWRVRPVDDASQEWEDRRVPMEPLPPRGDSGALLRPAVVWYGEYLPQEKLAAIEAFLAQPPDAAIIAGTSALIHYIQTWAW